MRWQRRKRLIWNGIFLLNYLANVFLIIIMEFVPLAKPHDLTSILRQNVYYNRDDVPTGNMGEKSLNYFLFLGTPTVVSIQMYIEGMSSFRAQTMDFALDIYFQERWVDERLVHNGSKRILVKDPNLFNLIWHPDLYFANAKTADFHHVTAPNFLVWIYPNGTVFYDYAYDLQQLAIRWNEDISGIPMDGGHSISPAIQTNPEILMPDMRLRKIVSGLRNDTYATGVWSCATAEFVVDRELMHHIIQSYLPSTLIVIISFFSFWLDVESVPGRISLSITTYVKASDVFGGACMAFAMIEFTIVNYCTRRKPSPKTPRQHHTMYENPQKIKNTKQKLSALVNETELDQKMPNGFIPENGLTLNPEEYDQYTFRGIFMDESSDDQPVTFRRVHSNASSFTSQNTKDNKNVNIRRRRLQQLEKNRKVAQAIDQRCRVYFPLAFFLFNIFYWFYYMIIANDEM